MWTEKLYSSLFNAKSGACQGQKGLTDIKTTQYKSAELRGHFEDFVLQKCFSSVHSIICLYKQ